jgi:hypothetical protein
MNNIYISLTEFMLIVNKSETTVRRFIKEVLISCNSLIIKIKNKYYLDKVLLDYFKYPYSYRISVSYFIFKIIQYPKMKVNKEKVKEEAYAQFEPYYETLYNDLSRVDWNLFCHVSYNREIPIEDCIYFFEKLYRKLKQKFGSQIYLFYTTEKDKSRRGHHNHFLLYSSESDTLPGIKYFIDAFFRRNYLGLTDVRIYDRKKDGLRYIMKQVPQINDGFELLSN